MKARRYRFDRRDNITDIEGRDLDQHYGYDALSRLISGEQPGEYDQRYEYDPNSNRDAFDDVVAGRQDHYTTADDSNRLQRITGHNAVSYDYDANGNIIRKTVNSQARTFSYNAANRLMMVDNQVLYDYNALGQRVSGSASSF